MSGESAHIIVVGSVNLDLVARAARLPVPGETVTGAELARYPGGKGANQALAARRLGAQVRLVACVGADASAGEALALLRAGGVNLEDCQVRDDRPTGTALISVGDSGENTIVVAPGANRKLDLNGYSLPSAAALICQLEVPRATLQTVVAGFKGFLCINLAPAMPVPSELVERPDLVVVNETEAAYFGDALSAASGFVAVTRGAGPAQLLRGGEVVAEVTPCRVDAVDSTGAGDAFTAALTLALVEGQAPHSALEFACAAGALAATRAGAQPSLPTRPEVEAFLVARARSN